MKYMRGSPIYYFISIVSLVCGDGFMSGLYCDPIALPWVLISMSFVGGVVVQNLLYTYNRVIWCVIFSQLIVMKI